MTQACLPSPAEHSSDTQIKMSLTPRTRLSIVQWSRLEAQPGSISWVSGFVKEPDPREAGFSLSSKASRGRWSHFLLVFGKRKQRLSEHEVPSIHPAGMAPGLGAKPRESFLQWDLAWIFFPSCFLQQDYSSDYDTERLSVPHLKSIPREKVTGRMSSWPSVSKRERWSLLLKYLLGSTLHVFHL